MLSHFQRHFGLEKRSLPKGTLPLGLIVLINQAIKSKLTFVYVPFKLFFAEVKFR